jgi:hypothetical protein
MSWQEFVASLVGSLAWPLVVVTAIIVFRTQLGNLIGRVKSVRTPGGVAVEMHEAFGDQLTLVAARGMEGELLTADSWAESVTVIRRYGELAEMAQESRMRRSSRATARWANDCFGSLSSRKPFPPRRSWRTYSKPARSIPCSTTPSTRCCPSDGGHATVRASTQP